jgi:hypothetical protein
VCSSDLVEYVLREHLIRVADGCQVIAAVPAL